MSSTTSPTLGQLFSRELDEASDFTIRAIVHVIISSKNRETVAWFLEDSLQKNRILEIYDLLKSSSSKSVALGHQKLREMVEDYTRYILLDD